MKAKYCQDCGSEIDQPYCGKSIRGRKLCDLCIFSRTRRNPGDEGFEVEWCWELPLIEGTTDADMDGAKWKRSYHKTLSDAMAMAQRQLPNDKFGAVEITPVRWEDQYPETDMEGRCYRWEPTGQSIEYSGDDK